MRLRILDRVVLASAIGALALVGPNGVPRAAAQQGHQEGKHQDQKDPKDQKKQKKEKQQEQKQHQQKQQQAQQQQRQHQRQQAQEAVQAQQQQRQHQRQQAQEAVQAQQHQQHQAQRLHRQQVRLSEARQQQLIQQQQQRAVRYGTLLRQQERQAERQAEALQQQRRLAQYRYQKLYLERLRQQQLAVEQARYYNYGQDPYFYTAPTYRYSYSGRNYETNQYGADLLRQGLNTGYEQGFQAGQADRQDGWRADYRNSYAYEDANYGYNGFYVNQGDYNYYFRQGFQRGYEDGYNNRSQYGQNVNGKYELLAGILSTLLNLTSLR